MLAVLLCERYGWTWEEYQNQPAFFIEAIVAKMKAESDEAKRIERKGKLMEAVNR